VKWLPISYCQYLIENRLENTGKLYCYLKYHSDGITDKLILKKAERYFEVSSRTVQRWLSPALSLNWIGQNDTLFFIRGWQFLFDTHGFTKRAAFQFRKSDLKHFKAFCYAAVIHNLARAQQSKERTSRRSKHCNAWVPLAANALSQVLGIPVPTARKYRNKATKLNYFKKRRMVKPMNIKVSELKQMRKFSPEISQTLFIRNGKVFKQLPDEILTKKKIHSPKRWKVNKDIARNKDCPNDGGESLTWDSSKKKKTSYPYRE